MKRALLLGATAYAANVGPVQKVLEMLADMVQRGRNEMKAEADTFEKIESIVHKRLIDADISIKREKSQIEKYDAIQQEAFSLAEKLDNDVAELEKVNGADIAEFDRRVALRKETKAAYQKEQKDLSESVDALSRAISVLKSSQGKQQTVSLLQDVAKTVPAVQSHLDALIEAQPGSYSYESQSGGILTVLGDLLKDFKGQLKECETGEANKQHAFEMFSLDMKDQIQNTKDEIADNKEEAGNQRARSGKALADKEAAAAALSEAQKLKKDTEQYEAMSKSAFEGNQQYRKDELKALNQAIEIISGEAVKGGSEKHFAKLVQTSFLQVNSAVVENARKADVMRRARDVVSSASSKMSKRSQVLSLLSAEIMTGGPFNKVIGMIEDMIARLEQEAKEEGEHKAWCDKNLRETGSDRDKTQEAVDKLKANLERLSAEKTGKQGDQKQLEDEVKQHNADMKEATEARNEERTENQVTIKDAQAAQTALEKAIEVLQNFYDKNGGEPSLLQQDPQIQSYSGMGESNTGVVGMLETIESDFARLEADTSAMEAQKQAEYERVSEDTKAMVVDKKQRISDTKIAIINLNASMNKNNKQLKVKSKELKAIMAYWDQLQPMCTVKQVSYEERVQQRNEEIEALKEAYEILSEEMGK